MIPRELLRKLRRIEIHTSRLANDQLAGSYHSVFKGRGMTFSEVRQYQPGDDVRFIDWNVSARMNDVYVKVFAEEREMTVLLLVDLSASGLFTSQSRSKIEVLAEVAALLAFSAIKNNDQVGLVLFTDRVERFVPPKRGRGHVMRVVTEILNAHPVGAGTDLRAPLDLVGRVGRRRSVVFLLSDFLDDAQAGALPAVDGQSGTGVSRAGVSRPRGGAQSASTNRGFEKALRLVAQRHDLIPIEVRDPAETALAPRGLEWLEDLESGEVFEVDTLDARVRARFARAVAEERAARARLFRRLQLDHVVLEPDGAYVRALSELFLRRQKRLQGYR